MFSLAFFAWCLTVVLLLVAAGIRPRRTSMSNFEKERRANLGDSSAKTAIWHDRLIGDVLSLQRIVVALLLITSVALSIAAYGWLLGITLSTILALEYGAVSHLSWLQRLSQKLYNRHRQGILNLVERMDGAFRYLGTIESEQDEALRSLDSRQDLQHLIDQSVGILTTDEKKLIVHSLSFGDKLVGSIMTPRSVIDGLNKNEFLGPLLLDELHKTGHSRLPVYDQDIDHVVGILHLQSLLALDIKRSVTAEKAMEPRVFYIREDQTLQHALAAFLRTHHHLFIVVNQFRETVGLLTLEDVMEALLGRRIVDEFDAHEDLRAVALRNLGENNHPADSQDV